EDDELAPGGLIDIDGKRQAHLLYEGFGAGKQGSALDQEARYEGPHKNSNTEVRQEIVDRRIEEVCVENAKNGDHHAHACRKPEWPQHRSPVTLEDVVPAQLHP